ncbi:MAG: penicillin-insensitive murein endopeptidase [Xanthobacteraceae bacterium]|nr:penicillin-insensitive murein endopeptidase [Xanthobacteraceae bacterium]
MIHRAGLPWLPAVIFVALACTGAAAQDRGTVNPKPLPPLANPNDPSTPAKELFGRKDAPAPLEARSIGFYTRGCLAGGVALPINGKTWQVMRLSRNRNWGHPDMIRVLERLADKVPKTSGWPGLLVGDMAQARGGPMRTGHASHQIGLDADIWLTPMPSRELTRQEREEMSATMVVAANKKDVDPSVWTPDHLAVLKTVAQDPDVERVLVNAAIKKALCREAGTDRAWLHKVRPWWGHDYHFHLRIGCRKGDTGCEAQPATPAGDGCGAELDYWFRDAILNPPPPKEPPKPRPPMTMANLPAACKQVLLAE